MAGETTVVTSTGIGSTALDVLDGSKLWPDAELISVNGVDILVIDAANPLKYSGSNGLDLWETPVGTVTQEDTSGVLASEFASVVSEPTGSSRNRRLSKLSLSHLVQKSSDTTDSPEPEHVTPIVLTSSNQQAKRWGNGLPFRNGVLRAKKSTFVSQGMTASVRSTPPEWFGMSRRRTITSAVAMIALLAVASPDLLGARNMRSHGQTEASVGANGTAELKYVDTKDELYTPEAQAKRAEMVRVPAGDWVKTNVPTVLKWENQVVDILSKYKTIHGVPIATNIDSGLVLSYMTTISAGDQFAKNPAETQKGLMGVPDDIGRLYFKNYEPYNSEHSIKAFLAQFSVALADVYKSEAPDRRTSIKLAILGTDRVQSIIPDREGAAKVSDLVPDFDNQWTSPTSAAFNRWFADKYVKQFIENAKNSQKESGKASLSVSKPN